MLHIEKDAVRTVIIEREVLKHNEGTPELLELCECLGEWPEKGTTPIDDVW